MSLFTNTYRILLVSLVLSGLGSAQTSELHWYKGNTHSHTVNSDGDSTPLEMATWYKTNGFDFLFITDHEQITAVDELNARLGDRGKFLVIQGMEISDSLNKKPYHVNGLGLREVVPPQHGVTVVSNVQKNVDAVRRAGGLAQINHPNFGWALTATDIAQIKGATLLEIFSGHPTVNMFGGGGSPSAESMWDDVLTGGMKIFAVAVDDSHSLKRLGDPKASTPGHGWVVVRASELTPTAILTALERGEFYSSTGVDLDDYQVTPSKIRVKIKEARLRKYTTVFIGSGGKILQTSIELESVYRRKGNEKYVRVKIVDSNGKIAWTQPVFGKAR